MTLQINIEEFEPSKIKKNVFYLPPIPWRWEVIDGSTVVGFGYCHTEDDANLSANKALSDYKTKKPRYS